MTTITLDKAKDDLPALVERALAGEEIVIETPGAASVKLAPVVVSQTFDEETARQRGYGSMKGQFEVPDSFFEPLPEDELKLWEGLGGA
jgi:antitoxin (DNA-binding transcriptional repressor) of toxin-antitoxin stability system